MDLETKIRPEKNKGTDQLRSYRKADLRLCFRICKKPVFSPRGSFFECLWMITESEFPYTLYTNLLKYLYKMCLILFLNNPFQFGGLCLNEIYKICGSVFELLTYFYSSGSSLICILLE